MQLRGELEKGGAKMAIENDIADDRPKVYLETGIIAGIREARRAFAAEHGNNLRAISEAAMKFALDCGFKPAEVPANPNFHYPRVSAAAV